MLEESKDMLCKISLIFLVSLCFNDSSLAKDFDDSEVLHIEYPDWFKESPFHDLVEDLDEARSKGKKGLMVLFTTEGCSYCSLFIKRSLGNPEISAAVQKSFDSIGMEIFNDVGMTNPGGVSTTIKQFAKEEGVQFSPTLLFYGEGGKRELRVIGYQSPERFRVILDYVKGNHFRNESLSNYFKHSLKEKPTTTYVSLKDDSLFTNPPYALDRSSIPASQPLLVIFEKPGCIECRDFHSDVLALKEVRNELGKFEIVRLDSADKKTPILTPDGKRATPASWFTQTTFTRVPALMLFDENGKKVLETDALVQRQRMMNSLNFVLERAYEKGWTYQRFARSKGIERSLKKQEGSKE